MPRLRLIVEENGEQKALEFEDARVTIGRTSDNAVRISDALSSRHHCQIERGPEGFVVEDLRSRNGTRLNGAPLTERRVLEPGDRIEVGDSIVHFEERRAAAPRKTTRRRRATPGPGAPLTTADGPRVRIVAGEDEGRVVALEPLPFVLGRKPSCALQVADEDISNEHAMVVEDAGALHLVDLGSTNGTFLDGEQLRGRGPLRQGSTVRLGARLTLQAEPVPEGGSARARRGSARVGKKKKRSARERRTSARAEAPAPAPAPAAPEEPPQGDVDEVESLDALGGDDAAPDDAAPAPARRRRPAAPVEKDPSAVVELEGDVIDVDLGARLEAAASESAGRGGGAVGLFALPLVLLAVFGAVAFAGYRILSEPPAEVQGEDNLVTNWSFEDGGGGELPGWELLADDAAPATGAEVRHGQRALALTVAPGSRPEVRSAPNGVIAGHAYRVRAAVAQAARTGVALRVDWTSETDPSFARAGVAVLVDPPSSARDWRDVSGVVTAPRGATHGRVVGVAWTPGEQRGRARFDRVSFVDAGEEGDAYEVLDGPGGLAVLADRRGVLTLYRGGLALADEVALALDPADALTAQGAARVDQPLARQTDESLLALGSLPDPAAGDVVQLAFTARAVAGGLRLRWSTGGEDRAVLHLGFRVPRLASVRPVELDGEPFPAEVPAEGLVVDSVEEMAWGSRAEQVSFRFSAPARLEATPAGGGVVLWFAVPPQPLATGELGVGVDLGAASSSTRARIDALLREARAARGAGDHARAMQTYQTLLREFPHEEDVVERARRELADVEAVAGRLERVAGEAAAEARELESEAVLDAARSAADELERGFGAGAARTARREVAAAERELAEERRRADAERVARLVARGVRYREAGHLHLARMVYTYVVEGFDPDVPGVADARDKLEAMPAPGGDR